MAEMDSLQAVKLLVRQRLGYIARHERQEAVLQREKPILQRLDAMYLDDRVESFPVFYARIADPDPSRAAVLRPTHEQLWRRFWCDHGVIV